MYRSGTVNSNTVNSKFHLIQSYCEIFFYNFPNISCLNYTVNSNFYLIRSKTLLMNKFELTVPDLYLSFAISLASYFLYLDSRYLEIFCLNFNYIYFSIFASNANYNFIIFA